MKLLINLIRNLLGGIIAAIDFVTRGSKLKRPEEKQQQIESELEKLSLYQFFACPFCVKTRRAIHRLNLDIELRDINKNRQHRQDLLNSHWPIVLTLVIDELL